MEVSITRSLNELKLLDKRINDAVTGARFISSAKRTSKKVDQVFTKEEFNKKAKASYDGILDLIKRRNLIKSLIVESNAKTKVAVGGKDMSVAEAIERKTTIAYDNLLLAQMKKQYKNAIATLNTKNEKVEQDLNTLIITLVGKEGKNSDNEAVTKMSETYKADNEWEVVDPLKLKEKIDQLQLDIDVFLSEVDLVLSESNAITKIKI